MKILILHISDIHLKEGSHIQIRKLEEMVTALNTIEGFSECVIVFSGDLAFEGKSNEYKIAKFFFGYLIKLIKEKIGDKFVNIIIVPGNHDLDMSNLTRDGKKIQNYHDTNEIHNNIETELSALKNFFEYAELNHCFKYNKIIDRRFLRFDNFKIQFNLINTAPFSTLLPDNKELHFFPTDKLFLINKADSDVNVVLTVMHHSIEWFNWKYKDELEKAISNSSSVLFIGHDHHMSTKNMQIDKIGDIIISTGGKIDASDLMHVDSYSSLLLDSEKNTLSRYTFEWDAKNDLFIHSIIFKDKDLFVKSDYLSPCHTYLDSFKEDSQRDLTNDFTQYFVFPKITGKKDEGYTEDCEINEFDKFVEELFDKKYLLIKGKENSGKTLTLKYIYYSLIGKIVPLFFSVGDVSLKKPEKLIENLFKEQYGEESYKYERFLQLNKSEKVIIVDNFDAFKNDKARDNLIKYFKESFGYIILATSKFSSYSIVNEVKEKITNNNEFFCLKLNPFYLSKRQTLIRNICQATSSLNSEDIEKVIQTINMLVHNQSNLFELTPDFIIQYTQYFIQNINSETQKGETIFSKIFESNIYNSIIKYAKENSDEMITALEEIAYYMHFNKLSILSETQLESIVEKYNYDYRVKINAPNLVEIACKAKILKRVTGTFSIKFCNNNYLAFFTARAVVRNFQENGDFDQIEYILRNICFGINDNIILFISYLTSNTKIIMSIYEQANELLNEWQEISFDDENICFLSNTSCEDIEAPSSGDKEKIESAQDKIEEVTLPEDEYELSELYDYDENDVEKYLYKVIRALKYTEMISKAIPGFHNTLKATQKAELVKGLYEFPNRILYALLKPIDEDYDNCVIMLKSFADNIGAKDKKGNSFSEAKIKQMITESAILVILSIYNNMAYLSTDKKSLDVINSYTFQNINHRLFNLMSLENYGNTDTFAKKAEELMHSNKNPNVSNMIRQIVRKHLIWTPNINFKSRQQLTDKFFRYKDKQQRSTMQKQFLIEQSKENKL